MKLDLVYIRRKYKNIKNVIIMLFLIMIVIYIVFITTLISNAQKSNKAFESYIAEKQRVSQIVEINKEVEEEQKEVLLPIFSEEARNNIKNIYKLDTKKAYLTFDDGPSKTVTIPILDLLKQENIKASFFVLGSRVELNPDIVKREYEEGHYIANHGYSHVYSQIYKSPENVLEEYNKTEQAIKNALQMQEYSSHLFRFPGGLHGGKYSKIKADASQILEINNIAYVDWNALTGDAEGKKTKEQMLEYLKQTVAEKKNVVVLMHDAGDKVVTYEVLPEVIAFLREKGYEFDNFYSIMK